MKNLIVCLFIFVISGCSIMGENKYSEVYVKRNIISNKTTQNDVVKLYGRPDYQKTRSDGSSTWTYYKSGNLELMQDAVSYLPGARGVFGEAVSTASMANSRADVVSKASSKMTNDTEHQGDRLTIEFNADKIVTNWLL
ncbi:hypothetical protein [Enterobacter bugandensis]|uniref:hypothetical protein n=1 Tax=Enterobacter bugandensis TaxID=881260 RepID=UPI002A83C2F1|nr:hypothetical protein [Enterobacter bugandensis]